MPAPTHCSELVMSYKQLCRSRLAHLQEGNNDAANDMDAVVIDIDDD